MNYRTVDYFNEVTCQQVQWCCSWCVLIVSWGQNMRLPYFVYINNNVEYCPDLSKNALDKWSISGPQSGVGPEPVWWGQLPVRGSSRAASVPHGDALHPAADWLVPEPSSGDRLLLQTGMNTPIMAGYRGGGSLYFPQTQSSTHVVSMFMSSILMRIQLRVLLRQHDAREVEAEHWTSMQVGVIGYYISDDSVVSLN